MTSARSSAQPVSEAAMQAVPRWRQRWQAWSDVQRVFAALAVFLTLLFTACTALVTTELIAGRATFYWAEGQKSSVNSSEKPAAQEIERGAYLAKLGNCAACHTARGGAAFAGGKAIHTPFGAVYTSNITPDVATGIGSWSAQAFYRALHEGRSADGHLLTPAFPYPNYTHVTRADADALYAYFMQGVAPVVQANRAHELPFPYNTQLALAVWRLLFFDQSTGDEGTQDTTKIIASRALFNGLAGQNGTENALQIARGAYLVRGLGHCSACHAQRNALGATVNDQLLSGALMPMQDWYAPSLMARDQAGVMHWPRADVVALLKTGVAPNASMAGPMAEVVAKSTQYWTDADLEATAAYLQALPETPLSTAAPPQAAKPAVPSQPSALFERGAQLYSQHCATCHGEQGQGMQLEGQGGQAKVALPALAGNRAITMDTSANVVRMVLAGGYPPSTAGNPRPFGMPPFVHVLSDTEIAAVATYIRAAWGNQADDVSAADVVRHRKGMLP
jgi:mono/diheme cytochrome c family protein